MVSNAPRHLAVADAAKHASKGVLATKLIANMVLILILVKSGHWTDECNRKITAAHTFVLKTLCIPENELTAMLVKKLNGKIKEPGQGLPCRVARPDQLQAADVRSDVP